MLALTKKKKKCLGFQSLQHYVFIIKLISNVIVYSMVDTLKRHYIEYTYHTKSVEFQTYFTIYRRAMDFYNCMTIEYSDFDALCIILQKF